MARHQPARPKRTRQPIRNPRRSAGEWAEFLARWEKSGDDLETFAQLHRLSTRSLRWWQWRLRARAPAEPARPALAFVPMVAASATTPDPAEARWVLETKGGARITMSGPNHVVIEGLLAALDRLRT